VNNTRYVIVFVLIMTVLAALMLAGTLQVTKAKAAENEAIFNKRAILMALGKNLTAEGKTAADMTDAQVLDVFNKQVEQVVVDQQGKPVDGVMAEKVDLAAERKKPEDQRLLPVFIFSRDTEKFYIFAVRGNGLWDEIWGNIALDADLNTVAGAAFDHKAETPGLGAEIKDNPAFPAQFQGRKLYDDTGKYVSVVVRKGGAVDKNHEVDGISGATITCDGVTQMLYKGLMMYQPFIEGLRSQQKLGSLN
jgi:Na+-transporting NADH:ubiquinone oxidoreductase subunit C